MDRTFYKSSGLNEGFISQYSDFADYISKTKDMISKARLDLQANDADWIVEANSPFELKPEGATDKAMLLVHGLFDCPYILKDLANFYVGQGFLVRSILLPGHGTVPGDLLNVRYQDWINAVHYGASSLQTEVKNIYVTGYSLGGALAIHEALINPNINGLILFAPVIQPQRPLAALFLSYHWLISWLIEDAKWYKKTPQRSFTKYESFACNGAHQTRLITLKIRSLLARRSLNIPLFIVVNEDDETVNTKANLAFFNQQNSKHKQLILYSNRPHLAINQNTILRPSAFQTEKILNFSHTCLTISPDNFYYGKNGAYQDFLHYPGQKAPTNDIYYGAISKDNLKKYTIQRLSYNPDFNWLLEQLKNFINKAGL